MSKKAEWPAWYYDPKTGEGEIFHNKKDVPKGWKDAPPKPETKNEHDL